MSKRRFLSILLVVMLLLAGCDKEPKEVSAPMVETAVSSSGEQHSGETSQPQSSAFAGAITLSNDYIASVADEILTQIITPQMNDYEKVRTVYEYIIVNTYFHDPVGLDLWRYRGDPNQIPTFTDNRALSPMLFGIGSCEDYAAAAAVMLQRLGFEAKYVPGLTISVDGVFVDHAWTVVKMGGRWYHLDTQLEDNIIRNSTLRYRYFLKDDDTMLADHRWGENLASYYGIRTEEELSYIKTITPPLCPQGQAPPPEKKITQAQTPNIAKITAEIKAEIDTYEKQHGALDPIQLNVDPPKLRIYS